jgi:hypothetical protein
MNKRIISSKQFLKIAIVWIVIFVFFLFTLEVYVRMRHAYYARKNREILYLEAGDKADKFIDTENKDNGLKYYDYHLYAAAPCRTRIATFTEYFSARDVPDSYLLGKGDIIIWLFGDSAMMELGTTDKLAIANNIALGLKELNIKATIFNFGVGGFQSSLEGIKFQDLLRRVEPYERPNFVIFYNGFNDSIYTYESGAGNIQLDLSRKLEMLVTGKYSKLLLYSISSVLSKFSYLWKYHIARKIDAVLFFHHYKPFNDNKNLAKGVEMYVLNTQMIRAICKEFHIKPIFILQPAIFTKKNLTNFEIEVKNSLNPEQLKFMEEFYEAVRRRMQNYADFADLTSVFDNSDRNDFSDPCHTGPYSGVDTGSHIAKIIAYEMIKN